MRRATPAKEPPAQRPKPKLRKLRPIRGKKPYRDPGDGRMRDPDTGKLVPPWENEDLLTFCFSQIGMFQRRWQIKQSLKEYWELNFSGEPELDPFALNKVLRAAKEAYVGILHPDPKDLKSQLGELLGNIAADKRCGFDVKVKAIEQLRELFGFGSKFAPSGMSQDQLTQQTRHSLRSMDESFTPAPSSPEVEARLKKLGGR